MYTIITHRPRGLPTATLRIPCRWTWEEKLQKILRIRSVFCFRIQSFQGFRVLGFRVRRLVNTKTLALRRFLSISRDNVWTPFKPRGQTIGSCRIIIIYNIYYIYYYYTILYIQYYDFYIYYMWDIWLILKFHALVRRIVPLYCKFEVETFSNWYHVRGTHHHFFGGRQQDPQRSLDSVVIPPYLQSLDGKSAGNHGFYHEKYGGFL